MDTRSPHRRPGRTRTRHLARAAVTFTLLAPVVLGAGSAGAEPGDTTTTLPSDGLTSLGDIVPKPNSGREPTSPGDPGGWQQGMLFFLICGAIVLIVGVVVWSARRARKRRAAAGFDPLEMAKRSGEGVRAPRQTQP